MTDDAMPPPRVDGGNLYGIMLMQAAMLCFVTNDMLSKLASGSMGTGQLITIRGLAAITLLILILAWSGHYRKIRQGLHPIVILRSLLEALSAILIMVALANIPLANASAILLSIPLAATAAAALFMKERVGIRRWSAIIVGFVGVLAIIRPGLDGFNIYSLFALGTVFCASARDLIARKIPIGTPLSVVSLSTMAVSTIAGGALAATEVWQPVAHSSLMLLAAAGLVLTLGHYAVVIAMQNGEISVVSTFRYISMPISLIYGYLFWRDVPDWLTWVGIALILASGLYTIFRERTLARARKAQTEVKSELSAKATVK